MKKIIAIIRYYDTNEIIDYTDENEFLKDLEDAIYSYGFNGWSYRVLDNSKLQKKVNKLIKNEFGY